MILTSSGRLSRREPISGHSTTQRSSRGRSIPTRISTRSPHRIRLWARNRSTNMETLEHAYDAALAVLTAPVSFVEWTTLKVNDAAEPDPAISDDWSPIGVWMHYGTDDYE